MRLLPRRFLLALAVVGVLLCTGVRGNESLAGGKHSSTYYFSLDSVRLAEGIPDEISEQVRAALLKEFGSRAEIITELPADAPDPAAAPKDFKKYIDKRKIKAYRVTVDVTAYENEVVEMPEGRGGKRLKVRVELHMFGETMPDRVMAFAGDGSAGVQVDIGNKVRVADTKYATSEALGLAATDATTISLAKLSAPVKVNKKAKKTKKRKRKAKSRKKH